MRVTHFDSLHGAAQLWADEGVATVGAVHVEPHPILIAHWSCGGTRLMLIPRFEHILNVHLSHIQLC